MQRRLASRCCADAPALHKEKHVIIDEERASDSPFVERMRHTTLTCVNLDMKRLGSCQLSGEKYLFHCFQKADHTRVEDISHPQNNQQNFNRFMSKCTRTKCLWKR